MNLYSEDETKKFIVFKRKKVKKPFYNITPFTRQVKVECVCENCNKIYLGNYLNTRYCYNCKPKKHVYKK
jgi:hypothetical protein